MNRIIIQLTGDLDDTIALAEQDTDIHLVISNPHAQDEGLVVHLEAKTDPEAVKEVLGDIDRTKARQNFPTN